MISSSLSIKSLDLTPMQKGAIILGAIAILSLVVAVVALTVLIPPVGAVVGSGVAIAAIYLAIGAGALGGAMAIAALVMGFFGKTRKDKSESLVTCPPVGIDHKNSNELIDRGSLKIKILSREQAAIVQSYLDSRADELLGNMRPWEEFILIRPEKMKEATGVECQVVIDKFGAITIL